MHHNLHIQGLTRTIAAAKGAMVAASIIQPAIETDSQANDVSDHASSLLAKSMPGGEGQSPKREALSYSCDQCHRFKVKCTREGDGNHCKRCANNGNTCTFSPALPQDGLKKLDTEMGWKPVKRNQTIVEQDDWSESDI